MKVKKWLSTIVTSTMVLSMLSAGVILPRSAQAAEAAASQVHGLKAEYYTNSGSPQFNFLTKKATVVDPNVNFDNLESALNQLTGQSDRVSVRWTGQISPAFSEDYTFSMIGDNGFRLWINNQLVIDHWVDDWEKEQVSAPVSLVAGQKYDFKIEYFENNGGSNLHLKWSSPSVPKQPIPTEAFYVPEGFEPVGTISEDGLKAEFHLDQAVKELPSNILDHIQVKVAGSNWPVSTVSFKDNDHSVVSLDLTDPVYSKDVTQVSVAYDGSGGLQTEEGTVVPAFTKFLQNGSKYQIMTPWASEVNENNALPEYPRPQLARDQWMNLNGKWEFQAAKENDEVPTGQTLKENILVPFATESILSGIHRVESLMWYKRSFTVPDNWNGERVKLNFGAVDYLATIYVNGQLVGTHKGGYTSFSFDITDYLKSGENELIVHVLDKTDMGDDQPVGKQTVKKLGGIWYTSVSGIWQTVWLEPVAPAHIEKLDMVPDIEHNVLKLKTATSGNGTLTVEATASANGEVVGTASGDAGTEISIPVPNARLWSPDDPFLYDLTVKLKSGAQVTDQVSSYFGMREIKLGMVDGIMRPLLNGNFVFQMGPLDQGFYPDGIYTAPTDEALKFDISTVKRIGMNTIRKHIKVEPARWYYWADKLGVLVWQDMPSLEDRQGNQGRDISDAAKTEWLRQYKEMVDQLRSVPSIIVWTVFNEGWGEFDAGGQLSKDAVNYVKSLDSTRLINNASGWWDTGAGDLVDMHSYPAPNSPTPSATRAAVLGEYGGLGLHVAGHEWTPLTFSYQLMNSKEELTDRYIQYINRVKELKNSGLSAAIYTQITDVEYEINGLMTYDRKVEKMDFDRIAEAHRSLTGSVNKSDLQAEITKAQTFLGHVRIGSGAGQYPQSAVNELQTIVQSAMDVMQNEQASVSNIQQALNAVKTGFKQLKLYVHDPIPNGAAVDSFDSAQLDAKWSIYRPDNTKWSLATKPGSLHIDSLGGDSFEKSNAIKNVFLQQAPEGDFSITTKVTASVSKNYQQAGLFIWQDEDNYARLGHVWDTDGSTGKSLETAYEKNAVYTKATHMAVHPGSDTVYLQLRKVGNQVTSYFWDGTAWAQAADPVTVDLNNVKVGLYTMSATDGTSVPVDFDYFTVGGAQASEEPTAVLDGPATVASGQPFDVTVGFQSVADSVYAQDLTVTYDPAKVEFVSADELKDGYMIVDQSSTPGTLRLITANVGGGSIDGDLIKLHWKAVTTAQSANTEITISKAISANGQGEESEYAGVTHSLSITASVDKVALRSAILDAQAKHDAAVEGDHAGQYPTGSKAALQSAIDAAQAVTDNTSATQQQVEQAISDLNAALQTFLNSVHTTTPGDTNNDGRFSVGDLAIIAAAYGKVSSDSDWEQYKQADLNSDGKVDLTDLTVMAQKIFE
ncbi:PA14 domain-containing protein [Paenibacillus hexagrammi]|uniref:PA14 domain-containing protein n=1 Tax=Paenibacillus hexagrammi TaxID=2908839 RepID=A0ABY3SCX2_9BACL|nr:PA14 domain-containing protein [Paenibacillus sp. YPD9-1]UJF31335.1 PA14 domain-containing protein [Paenibacillus sp. YPD9-1]